jgi:hypothetical protein
MKVSTIEIDRQTVRHSDDMKERLKAMGVSNP